MTWGGGERRESKRLGGGVKGIWIIRKKVKASEMTAYLKRKPNGSTETFDTRGGGDREKRKRKEGWNSNQPKGYHMSQ